MRDLPPGAVLIPPDEIRVGTRLKSLTQVVEVTAILERADVRELTICSADGREEQFPLTRKGIGLRGYPSQGKGG